MPFKLVIRQNIGDDSDEFTGADVRHFDATEVSVGSSTACTCPISDPDSFKPRHFCIGIDKDNGYLLIPEKSARVFHNQKPVHAPVSLTSGDEIRVGHHVLRFQREHRAVRPSHRSDILEYLAKAIIIVVLCMELFFVYWLPRRIQSERLLANEIIKQQTVTLLDNTRNRARHGGRENSDYQKYAYRLLLEELDRMARFIREKEKRLGDGQWNWLYQATRKLSTALSDVEDGLIRHPLPDAALEKGVQAVLDAEPLDDKRNATVKANPDE